MSAAHYRLGNLVAIVDLNGMTLDGPTQEVMNIEPVAGKFEAFGWRTQELDGHDMDEIVAALDGLPDTASEQPTCLLARTRKGKGVPFMELSPGGTSGTLGGRDKELAVAAIKERMG